MRILLAQINPIVGDIQGNAEKIIRSIEEGKRVKADLALFPELAISGYPPKDLVLLPHFMNEIDKALERIIAHTQGIIAIVGTPRINPHKKEKPLYNSAAVIENGELLGYQDKTLLPTYDVFDERRYFEPGNKFSLWRLKGQNVAITICEDAWEHTAEIKSTRYMVDPVKEMKRLKPDLMLNLSASPYSFNKFNKRFRVFSGAAQSSNCPVALCGQAGGNDSLIFDGYSFLVDRKGKLLEIAKGFEEDLLLVDSEKKDPIVFETNPLEDLYRALKLGLKDYFLKSGFKTACLGLSGGIDSAIVACIAADALGSGNVFSYSLPSRFTSEQSRKDAKKLAKNLKIHFEEISIEKPFKSFLSILNPVFGDLPQDVTEENIQSRIRGMILMAISNKLGHLVLSTGNKSELAMGYATLYGDMCGGLAILNDVTKAQVYDLAQWINQEKEIIPQSIIERAPTAELRPGQKDSDSLPAYEMIDQVLSLYVEEHLSPKTISEKLDYPLELVEDIVKRVHRNEYKRRQSAPGLRVSEKAFSVGYNFPIVQKFV